jgi:hypothetical protein
MKILNPENRWVPFFFSFFFFFHKTDQFHRMKRVRFLGLIFKEKTSWLLNWLSTKPSYPDLLQLIIWSSSFLMYSKAKKRRRSKNLDQSPSWVLDEQGTCEKKWEIKNENRKVLRIPSSQFPSQTLCQAMVSVVSKGGWDVKSRSDVNLHLHRPTKRKQLKI